MKKAEFYIWATDKTLQGPMELTALVARVKEERVTAGTWIFAAQDSVWLRAADVPELQMFFQVKPQNHAAEGGSFQTIRGIDVRALRRVKLLSFLSDEQLDRFVQFTEVERAPQWSVIVRQGDRGDAMYVILEGELSVCMNVAGQKTTLANLGMGDFFGDFSLFDHGPRSADVVACTTSLLLKISAAAFARMSHEAPDVATPFLVAIGKTLTARIRAGNKHHAEAVKFASALQ